MTVPSVVHTSEGAFCSTDAFGYVTLDDGTEVEMGFAERMDLRNGELVFEFRLRTNNKRKVGPVRIRSGDMEVVGSASRIINMGGSWLLEVPVTLNTPK